mmetsp:Transcript_41727/g.49987  ORF Transcript_41727/g.49987 Transcript_41727/m.49987 type:complete len:391 (-) Transcript_41727:89-1261(-)|eukprot:CAMPEP_0194355228 /NCGR_PEP_ID=MMETSP0174-20130528/3179_1 /TAXON_ID=216777 /ORGANISM="Proboscia alata, Strain PI-D3" /LENGTH=390 /DNA_ID=CAMNT_0039124431 /DNA_START=104 /DNA_END=1276 /DNA_ORIENTATION=-
MKKNRVREIIRANRFIGVLAVVALLLTLPGGTELFAGEIIFKARVHPVASFTPLFNQYLSDPWKKTLYARLDRIRSACGDLCYISNQTHYDSKKLVFPGTSFPTLTANVDCRSIMLSNDIDARENSVPYPTPEELIDIFTVGGAIELQEVGMLSSVARKAPQNIWSTFMIDQMLMKTDLGFPPGLFGINETKIILNKLSQIDMKGKRIFVIGNGEPWLEVICIHLGASDVTTLRQSGVLQSQHTSIRIITPNQLRTEYMDGTLGKFDVVVSHSTIGHIGLGRFGDSLNPWGDILSLARAWCIAQPGAHLYLGLPTGKDSVLFNAYRQYGKFRWSLVTTNWLQIDGEDHKDDELVFTSKFDKSDVGRGFIFKKFNPKVAEMIIEHHEVLSS